MENLQHERHGGDVYRQDGRPAKFLDFSTTVGAQAPPREWRARALKGLEGLQSYPQPYSSGLASRVEARLGLPKGSVLVCDGVSEALGWIAFSLAGRAVALEKPCFGGYEAALARAGCRVRAVEGRPPLRPPLELLRAALGACQSLWIANPSSPAGLRLEAGDLGRLLEAGRARGRLLVVDETLEAQCLRPPESLLKRATRAPGCLVLRSLSKGMGLPGLRLGFVAGHPGQVRALRAFQDPWSVNSLAQALGPWLLDASSRRSAAARGDLARSRRDLVERLSALSIPGLKCGPSDTGFFLLEAPMRAASLAARLRGLGILARPCEGFGAWGGRRLRLNPRTPGENQALARALGSILGRERPSKGGAR